MKWWIWLLIIAFLWMVGQGRAINENESFEKDKCPLCDGFGVQCGHEEPCPRCNGTGKY